MVGAPPPKRSRIWAATVLLQHTSLNELQHLDHENNNLYGQSGTFASGKFWSKKICFRNFWSKKICFRNFLIQENLLQEIFDTRTFASGTVLFFLQIISENKWPPTIIFLKTSSNCHLSISSLMGIEIYRNFKIPDFILVWDFYSWLRLLPFHQAWLNDKFPFKGGLLAVKACFKNSSKIRYFNRLEYSQLRV